jgi:hypothetical protein
MTKKNLDDSGQKGTSRSLRGGLSKSELEHKYKIELIRNCQIYGKSFKEAKAYFAAQGFSLSSSHWKNLKKELTTRTSAKEWFSKEALYIIEEDHMNSVERIRSIESLIVKQIHKLMGEGDFDTKVHFDTTDKGVKQRVENYNTELLIKLTSQFESIQMTKTKMFSATPMVQELIEVHARQEQEESKAQEAAPHA